LKKYKLAFIQNKIKGDNMKQIALTVPDELHDRVKQYAKRKYSSIASVVRNLIAEKVSEDENDK
jgi:predicted DNA-binding protein